MNRRLMMDRNCATIGEVYPDSFQSCSHGAGRAMSRTEAVHGLGVAAYDSRKGVVETPELIELDFRFLLLLSECRSLCLSSAKIGTLSVEIWQ